MKNFRFRELDIAGFEHTEDPKTVTLITCNNEKHTVLKEDLMELAMSLKYEGPLRVIAEALLDSERFEARFNAAQDESAYPCTPASPTQSPCAHHSDDEGCNHPTPSLSDT